MTCTWSVRVMFTPLLDKVSEFKPGWLKNDAQVTLMACVPPGRTGEIQRMCKENGDSSMCPIMEDEKRYTCTLHLLTLARFKETLNRKTPENVLSR